MKIQTQHQLPDYLKNKKKKLKYQIHFSMIQYITYLSFNVKKAGYVIFLKLHLYFFRARFEKKEKRTNLKNFIFKKFDNLSIDRS